MPGVDLTPSIANAAHVAAAHAGPVAAQPQAAAGPRPLTLQPPEAHRYHEHKPPLKLASPKTTWISLFLGRHNRVFLQNRAARLESQAKAALGSGAPPDARQKALAAKAIDTLEHLASHPQTSRDEKIDLLQKCVDLHIRAYGEPNPAREMADGRGEFGPKHPMTRISMELADLYIWRATGRDYSFARGSITGGQRPPAAQFDALAYARALQVRGLAQCYGQQVLALPTVGSFYQGVADFANASIELHPRDFSGAELHDSAIEQGRHAQERLLDSVPLRKAMPSGLHNALKAAYRRAVDEQLTAEARVAGGAIAKELVASTNLNANVSGLVAEYVTGVNPLQRAAPEVLARSHLPGVAAARPSIDMDVPD